MSGCLRSSLGVFFQLQFPKAVPREPSIVSATESCFFDDYFRAQPRQRSTLEKPSVGRGRARKSFYYFITFAQNLRRILRCRCCRPSRTPTTLYLKLLQLDVQSTARLLGLSECSHAALQATSSAQLWSTAPSTSTPAETDSTETEPGSTHKTHTHF